MTAALAVAVGIFAFAIPRAPSAIEGGRTSVLLVVVDTLRADRLGAWGHPHPTSPTLDALAAEGVRFSHFFSNASWTRPAMASLFTGLHPRSTGVYEEQHDRLAEEIVTLAEVLQDEGYHTLGVNSNPNINAHYGTSQGFGSWLDSGIDASGETSHTRTMETAEVITDRVLRLVDQDAAALREAPYLLHVQYIDPHGPYAPPDEHREAVEASGSDHPEYDGEIRFADTEIARLLRGLERRGLMDDTLVVVTSDHGEGLASHPHVPLADRHGTHLYDSNVHVPLIWHHPALTGRVVEALAATVDLAPTLLDLLGYAFPGAVQGRSYAALVRGEPAPADLPDRVFLETDWRVNRKVAVRTTTHKYVRNDDCRAWQEERVHEGRVLADHDRHMLEAVPPVELFDLTWGASEVPATSVLAQQTEVAEALVSSLDAWELATPSRPPLQRTTEDVLVLGDGTVVPVGDSDAGAPDAATRQALEALGYLVSPGP